MNACRFCGTHVPADSVRYLCVTKTSGLGTVRARYFACKLCGQCIGKVRRIQWVRVSLLLFAFIAPAIWCGGLPLLFMSVKAGEVFSVQAGMVLTVLTWIAFPMVAAFWTRRLTRRCLTEAWDREIRKRADVRGWGFWTSLGVVRRAPEGASWKNL